MGIYYQFILLGKIPVPADTLVGSYYPWLDYKWGYAVGVPVKNPPISDVFSQFFLWKYLTIDLIKSGNWPLWNLYSSSGTPLLATYHSATLNPFNLLLFLPKYFGWGLYIFGQTFFAATGMYLLLGKYIKSPSARIGGSLVFSLASLMTTWVEFGTAGWAASMLPWIFWAVESFLVSSRIRFLLVIALSYTILFLSGHAQLTLYSSTLFLAYLLVNFRFKLLLIWPLLFWFLAILISAIQFLPTMDLVHSSIRANEAYSRGFNFGLNPWYEFIRFFAADFFGNPTTYNYWDKISYHEQTSFLGTLTLPLILPFIFLLIQLKKTKFWVFVFLLTIFLAFDNPISSWIYSLPLPFLTYSSASRIFFITSFAAAVLVSFGIEFFQKDDRFHFWSQKSSLALILILSSILIGMYFSKHFLESNQHLIFVQKTIDNFNISIKNSILPLMLLTIFYLLSLVKRKWVIYIIVLILFFDLGRYFLKYNPFVPSLLVFPNTPIHDFFKRQPGLFRIARADMEIHPPNTWTAYNLSSIEGYDPLTLANYARFFHLVNGNNYQNSVSRYLELQKYPSNFLNFLNVKYLLAVKRDGKGKIGGDYLNQKLLKTNYKTVFEDKNSVVLENPNVLDRAFFPEQVKTFRSSEELIIALQNPFFDPTKTALILSDKNLINNAPGKVTFINYSASNVKLKTEVKKLSFLVLSDTYEKGWQLYQNGQKAKLYQVDEALQGFFVPAGEAFFELKYWPKSFDVGLKISFVSILILVSFSIYSFRKKYF